MSDPQGSSKSFLFPKARKLPLQYSTKGVPAAPKFQPYPHLPRPLRSRDCPARSPGQGGARSWGRCPLPSPLALPVPALLLLRTQQGLQPFHPEAWAREIQTEHFTPLVEGGDFIPLRVSGRERFPSVVHGPAEGVRCVEWGNCCRKSLTTLSTVVESPITALSPSMPTRW